MKEEKYKCNICGEHIDITACELNYMIITNINHRPSPIKKVRTYICEDCTYEVNKHVELLILEQKTSETKYTNYNYK